MDLTKFYNSAYTWILQVGPRLIAALIFFMLAQWVIKMLKRWMNKALFKKNIHSSLKPFLVSLSAAILQILAMLAVLQILNLELTVFTAIVGGISVAAGLALSGTLQNFTSGILILLLKPYRVDDIIVTQGQEGIVKSIQIFHTILTTYDNKTVIIPNSKLSNDIIVNLSMEGTRRLDIQLHFSFDTELEKIKQDLLDAINNFSGVLNNPKAVIGISEIQADGYQIELNIWLNTKDYYASRRDLQEQLLEVLKQLSKHSAQAS